MKILIVPTLFDNYTYLIVNEQSKETIIVDCPEMDPVTRAIEQNQLKPIVIFSTHHHPDHVAANEELVTKYHIPVYGGQNDKHRIPAITHPVKEGDEIEIAQMKFAILDIPGHTTGHIAYYVKNEALFCGDTLFSCGCGRLFEGTAEQMFASLAKIKKLPGQTKIYCGHEYSQQNRKFCMELEPNNQFLKHKYLEAIEQGKKNEPTIPTTLENELKMNCFLRCNTAEDFARIRKLKDNWH